LLVPYSPCCSALGCYTKSAPKNKDEAAPSAGAPIAAAEANESIASDDIVVPKKKPEVTVLFNGNADVSAVLLDLLEKAGFIVNVDIQPDNASFYTKVDAGNFDLAFTYWTTTIGSPDCFVRSVWHSEGSRNSCLLVKRWILVP
jgi:ABC-type transport system substrate-binding protein